MAPRSTTSLAVPVWLMQCGPYLFHPTVLDVTNTTPWLSPFLESRFLTFPRYAMFRFLFLVSLLPSSMSKLFLPFACSHLLIDLRKHFCWFSPQLSYRLCDIRGSRIISRPKVLPRLRTLHASGHASTQASHGSASCPPNVTLRPAPFMPLNAGAATCSYCGRRRAGTELKSAPS